MKKEVKEVKESILAQLETMDEKDLKKVLDFIAKMAAGTGQEQGRNRGWTDV